MPNWRPSLLLLLLPCTSIRYSSTALPPPVSTSLVDTSCKLPRVCRCVWYNENTTRSSCHIIVALNPSFTVIIIIVAVEMNGTTKSMKSTRMIPEATCSGNWVHPNIWAGDHVTSCQSRQDERRYIAYHWCASVTYVYLKLSRLYSILTDCQHFSRRHTSRISK